MHAGWVRGRLSWSLPLLREIREGGDNKRRARVRFFIYLLPIDGDVCIQA